MLKSRNTEILKHSCLPIADELASTVLSLPIGPHLSAEKTNDVIGKLNSYLISV
jgi:dTDP-4-amino-4,6-dideoxygalactose transaminase